MSLMPWTFANDKNDVITDGQQFVPLGQQTELSIMAAQLVSANAVLPFVPPPPIVPDVSYTADQLTQLLVKAGTIPAPTVAVSSPMLLPSKGS
jgi:hypothetical protein